jgi:hypothetical protein
MLNLNHRPARRQALSTFVALVFAGSVPRPALAFTTNITAATPRAIYLQVGVGRFTGGNFNAGGTPGNNPTVNLVSVTVPAGAVGSGAPQAMTTNSTVGASSYDGFVFCNTPAQLYIGGFYRFNNNTAGAAATLTATSPANLTSAGGDTIPFTQISWTSSGNSDSGTQPFPAGAFTGATQTIGTIARNQWAESCHTFSYANSTIRAAGTYNGRVTYTLTAP